MNFGNVYGMLANALLLLMISLGVIICDRIKIRQQRREIAELEYELEKYEQYDDEEKRTVDDYECSFDKYGTSMPAKSGRYPGTGLAKPYKNKEH